MTRLRKAVRNPSAALKVSMALARGRWYVAWARMRGIRFRAGRNFKVFGRIRFRGPGEVVFGDDVSVFGTITPWTYSPHARITVGDNTMMSAPRFGCAQEITIGRDCIIAEVRITDTDFHSTRADRRSPEAPIRTAPVVVGDNVWIGELAALLAGTRIGRDSVVSFGAVCMREYPPAVIIMGNPGKVAAPIPSLPGERQGAEEQPVAKVGSDAGQSTHPVS